MQACCEFRLSPEEAPGARQARWGRHGTWRRCARAASRMSSMPRPSCHASTGEPACSDISLGLEPSRHCERGTCCVGRTPYTPGVSRHAFGLEWGFRLVALCLRLSSRRLCCDKLPSGGPCFFTCWLPLVVLAAEDGQLPSGSGCGTRQCRCLTTWRRT